jgi:hypothetical protein
MEMKYEFNVECIESGQRGKYQDSFYHYRVTSDRSEYEVKNFCMNVLRKSYERKDMTSPFDGELLLFEKETNNNEGKSFLDEKSPETYVYKTKELYTG